MENRLISKTTFKFLLPLFCATSLVSCITVYRIPIGEQNASNYTAKQKEFYKKYNLKSYTSIFDDTSFSQGFAIPEARDSITHYYSNPRKYKYIDYNDQTGFTTKYTNQKYQLSQWWRPDYYDLLKNYTYTHNDSIYEWKNPARTIKVDKETGALTLQCDSSKEYEARTDEPDYVDAAQKELICAIRDENGHIIEITDRGTIDRWPHFLLESSVPADINDYYSLCDYDKVYVDFDFVLNHSRYTGTRSASERANNPLSYRYAAQIFFYVCVFNSPKANITIEKNKGIWVGIPLYDSRYNNYSREVGLDVGFTGATNRVIYKCAQSEANPAISDSSGVQVGTTYKIHYDIMPLIREAYSYAYSIDPNGPYGVASFEGMPWNQLKLSYFNIGYEIPGSYDISATISNFDIYYE